MRVAWVILGVAAAAGLWASCGGAGNAPPAQGVGAESPPETSPDPIVVERLTVPEPPPEGSRVEPPAATPVAPVSPPPLAAGEGRIRFHVLDVVTNRPVLSYRCTFKAPALGKALFSTAEDMFLDLPLDLAGDLLVEAEGYTPETRADMSIPPSDPDLLLTVYLNPVAPFSGIEIQAVDDHGAPVTHLQVTAWRGDAGRPLWVRRSADQAGNYQLPDLQPGTYRLELAAVDEGGERLPLLTHSETVTFGGSERIPLPVQLEPAAVLTVTVLDVATDEPRGTEVSLRMVFPDGRTPSLVWRSRLGQEIVERREGLPAAAPASLAEPVPPGTYRLILELPGGTQTFRDVFLSAGHHEKLEIRM